MFINSYRVHETCLEMPVVFTGSQRIVYDHVENHMDLRQIGMPRDKNVTRLQAFARCGFLRLQTTLIIFCTILITTVQ